MAPVIVDTSAMLAFFGASEPDHEAVSVVIAAAAGVVGSPYAPAELDYRVATRHGVDDELGVLDELAGGARDLAALDDEGLGRTREIVASVDHRHFDILWSLGGGSFEALPLMG